MTKRLVVCCDGTWNFPDQKSPTNVTKIALAVAPEDKDGVEQRVFYHRGVGTNRFERFRGGAFGAGLSRNVCDTYRFLVQNYEPGDELFFFGFSRGAFTARSAAGLVRNAGILRPDHTDRIGEAYSLYRSRNDNNTPRGREATLFRRSYSHEPDIHFVGVFDTVGALGVPVDGSRLIAMFNKRWQFHNTDLSTTVHNAFQALAIDEKRRPFKPAVWNVQASAPENQRVEQVWFAGVHSDVGGGYPDHAVSDIPLLWMVDRARQCGLHFNSQAFAHSHIEPESEDIVQTCTWVDPDPIGGLNESRKKFYKLQPPLQRSLQYVDQEVQTKKQEEAKQWRKRSNSEPHVAFLNNGEFVAQSAVKRRADEKAKYGPSGFVKYLDDKHSQGDDDYFGPFATDRGSPPTAAIAAEPQAHALDGAVHSSL
jgi:hypothetical protein